MDTINVSQLMRVDLKARDKEWLLQALQAAADLEHSTLPPYLSAWWSIKDEYHEVYDILKSIVIDEMRHMGYFCNLLTVIGGSVNLKKGISYPSYILPGNVKPKHLKQGVWIQGLTKGYIEFVFMPIERPDWNPVAPPPDRGLKKSVVDEPYPSIGRFLEAVKETYLALLEKESIAIDADRQINYPSFFKKIITASDVRAIIDEIAEQGEGRRDSPKDNLLDPKELDKMIASKDLAHYYRFAEILYGKRLVKNRDGTYSYTGDPVPFPECFPVARIGPDGYGEITRPFNDIYSSMLNTMDEAWSDPQNGVSRLQDSIRIMRQLRRPAQALMQTPLPDGSGNYGPDFRYLGDTL